MRVLVTGARGFVGGHVVEALRRAGQDVVGVGRAEGDLAEAGVAEDLLDAHKPDAVVHLAALVGWVAGEHDPLETIRQNTGVTAVVARACAAAGIRLAHGSTTEVYAARSIYALSKRWSEDAAVYFCPEATLLRFAWPYGPGVSPGQGRGAIVNMLDQAVRRERIVVHRGPERSWCWIGDAARAVVLLLERRARGAWDIGRDDQPVSMLELARLCCRLTGASEDLIQEIGPPAQQGASRPLATEQLLAAGWRPEVDIETGLRDTLVWLRSAGPSLASRPA